jgi:hypothetical protein
MMYEEYIDTARASVLLNSWISLLHATNILEDSD